MSLSAAQCDNNSSAQSTHTQAKDREQRYVSSGGGTQSQADDLRMPPFLPACPSAKLASSANFILLFCTSFYCLQVTYTTAVSAVAASDEEAVLQHDKCRSSVAYSGVLLCCCCCCTSTLPAPISVSMAKVKLVPGKKDRQRRRRRKESDKQTVNTNRTHIKTRTKIRPKREKKCTQSS